MICWHCENELVEFEFDLATLSKFYECPNCNKWYEMRKDRERVNGAVPVRFFELDTRPPLAVSHTVTV
jgi:hypothetical protein